jgi:HEAT repeat protein
LATTEAAAEQTPQDRNEQRIVLALLDNPSATQRLRGVSYTKNIGEVNQQVVNALLSTLNNDPNVNVRLATLDALAVLGQDPTVRQGLVHSLTKQDSPLVQSALADVMVQLQVRRSVKPMKQMLQQENLNEAVKTKIESSIQTLSNGRSAGPSTSTDETPRSTQPRANDTVAA